MLGVGARVIQVLPKGPSMPAAVRLVAMGFASGGVPDSNSKGFRVKGLGFKGLRLGL